MNTQIPEIKKYYVAYFDMLGYKQYLIDNPAGAQDLLSRVYYFIQETVSSIENINYVIGAIGGKNNLFQFKTFSDNIVLYYQYDDMSSSKYMLLSFIEILKCIQWSLIEKYGVFIRGGVTTGNFAENEVFIFGPALVQAVTLEEEVARAPIFVLSEAIISELQESPHIFTAQEKTALNVLNQSLHGLFLDSSTQSLYQRSICALDLYDDILAAAQTKFGGNESPAAIKLKHIFTRTRMLVNQANTLCPTTLEPLFRIIKDAYIDVFSIARSTAGNRALTVEKFNDIRMVADIKERDDGYWFIDYLSVPELTSMIDTIQSNLDEWIVEFEKAMGTRVDMVESMKKFLSNGTLTSAQYNMETHKLIIENQLLKFQSNLNVLSKYEWLSKYHNSLCIGSLEPYKITDIRHSIDVESDGTLT